MQVLFFDLADRLSKTYEECVTPRMQVHPRAPTNSSSKKEFPSPLWQGRLAAELCSPPHRGTA